MTGCFRVVAAFWSTVMARSPSGDLVHLDRDARGASTPIVLWCPDLTAGNAILIAPSPGIAMWPLTGFSSAQRLIGVALVPAQSGYALSFTPGRYISALPPGGPDVPGRLEFGRTDPQGWEIFQLEPLELALLAPDIQAVLKHLSPYFKGPVLAQALPSPPGDPATGTAPRAQGARSVLSTLARLFRFGAAETPLPVQTVEPDMDIASVLDALAGVLPRAQWVEFSLRLAADLQRWAARTSVADRDPWIAHALPELAAWLQDRQRPVRTQITVGKEFDPMSQAGIAGTLATAGHIAATTLRRLVAPRKTCCALATARNEGLYLIEWVAHHRALGFQHFFIYSNDNDDGSDQLLEALAAAGEVTWLRAISSEGTRAQNKAYGHALSILPEILDYEWTAIIDLDEFVYLDPEFGSITQFLRRRQEKPTDAIGLNWLMYGSNGEDHWRDQPLAQRCPCPFDYVSSTIKTIARTNLFFHSQPHFPIADAPTAVHFRTADGDVHPYNPNSTATAASERGSLDSAWVAHFAYKSLDEFLWKNSRNTGDAPSVESRRFSIRPEIADIFAKEHRSSGDPGRPALPSLAEQAAEIARIKALPNVAPAYDRVVESYRSKIGGVRDGFREALAGTADPALQRLVELISASASNDP